MVSESFTLFRAHDLERVSDGGGVEGEGITVHHVPLAEIEGFIAARRAEGYGIDVRILMLLGPRLLGGT
jgi:ADP-ribose pyrophosphatase